MLTFQEAAAVTGTLGDPRAEATALNSIGLALQAQVRHDEAIAHFERAIRIQERIGARRGEALTRANLGRSQTEEGHFDEAIANLNSACKTFADLLDSYSEARTWSALGALHLRAERAEVGRRYLHRALDAMREHGAHLEQAQILELLGDAARRSSDERQARRYYDEAEQLRSGWETDNGRTRELNR
jgi:tetratricopeptide (TPR) repeat protein